MALVVKDRVRETSTTTGTGTITLAGAVTGYQSFSAIGNANTTYYTIYLQGGNEWEVGIGTYTASGTTLSRDTILASSNGGSAVNFSAGTKDVFVTYPAGRSVWYDSATNVTLNALTLSGGTANGVLYLNGSKVATSGSALTFDGTSLGVGAAWTTNPMRSTQPQYFQYGAASTANVIAADGVALFQAMRFSSNNSGAFLILSKGRGTYASPTAVASGDNIGSLDFRVYGGTNSRTVAQINGVVDAYTSDANISSYLTFGTSPSGSAAVTERVRITSGGQLNLGGNFTSTNNTLQVTGNAAIGYTAAAPANGLIVSGNVGVGTDSPNDALEVVGSGAAGIRVSRSGASSQYVTISSGSTGPTINASTGINELSMGVNGARSMLINSSGNVGIGTTSPGAKLDVQGTSLRLNLQSTSNGQYATWKYVGKTSAGAAVDFEQGINITADNAFEIYDNTNTQNVSRYFNGASGYWQWFTNGTEKMRLDSSGNLGIGTSSLYAKLTSKGTGGAATTTYKGIFNVYNADVDVGLSIGGYNPSPYAMYIQALDPRNGFSTTYPLSLNPDGGNVGIGTSSPSTSLHILKDIGGGISGPTAVISLGGNSAYRAAVAGYQFNYADRMGLGLYYYGAAGQQLGALLDASGNLGLGVTPSTMNTITAMQLGYSGIIAGQQGTAEVFYCGSNWYYNSGFKYKNNGYATRYNTDSGAHSWYTAASGTADATITFTQAMTLDASGNLGVGTTSVNAKLEVQASAGEIARFSTAAGYRLHVYANASGNAGSGIQAQNSDLRLSAFDASTNIRFFTGNGSTETERARITSGGNFGIGVTNPTYTLDVTGSTSTARLGKLTITNDTPFLTGANLDAGAQSFALGTSGAGIVGFFANNGEAARITTGRYFKASNSGTYISSTGSYHELRQTATDLDVLQISNTAASPYGVVVNFTAASPNNTTNTFLLCKDSTANRCFIYSSGSLANSTGTYGTISDQKLKQDIVDAGSQWDDLKAIRFRKYRMRSDVAANPDAPAMLGVVAQELEQVSPGLVEESPDRDQEGNDLGTTTKSVKTSVLLMKAAVALQEAMARIEQLEAKVAVLEAK